MNDLPHERFEMSFLSYFRHETHSRRGRFGSVLLHGCDFHSRTHIRCSRLVQLILFLERDKVAEEEIKFST